jgi:hypothetical protein
MPVPEWKLLGYTQAVFLRVPNAGFTRYGK